MRAHGEKAAADALLAAAQFLSCKLARYLASRREWYYERDVNAALVGLDDAIDGYRRTLEGKGEKR